MKAGRKVCVKLETRIKELEGELDNEQRRLGDNTKSLRKYERRIKEIEFQVGHRATLHHIVYFNFGQFSSASEFEISIYQFHCF